MSKTNAEKPVLTRTVKHSRRYFFLDGKRISEKEAVWLVSRDAVEHSVLELARRGRI